MRTAFFLVFTVTLMAWSSSAFAQCQCGRTCGELVFVGDELPANAQGVAAWQTWTDWANVQIVLEKLATDGTTIVETSVVADTTNVVGNTVLIVPAEAWEEGTTYRLSLDADSEAVDDIACGRGTARSLTNEFTIVAAVSTLSSPAAPTASDPVRADSEWPDGDEECSRTLDTLRTTVDFELPPEIAGLEDMVQWEIEVDGEPSLYVMSVCETFPPGRAPSEDTLGDIAVACSPWQDGYPEGAALQPGSKDVVVTGRLAGTDVVFATSPVTVDLNCEALPEPSTDDDGGCAVGGSDAAGTVLVFLALIGLVRRRRRV